MGMSMLVIFLHFKFTAPIGQDKSIFHGCRSHLNRWIELADLLAWERGVRWFKSITHDEWPSRVTPLARFSRDQIKKGGVRLSHCFRYQGLQGWYLSHCTGREMSKLYKSFGPFSSLPLFLLIFFNYSQKACAFIFLSFGFFLLQHDPFQHFASGLAAFERLESEFKIIASALE